MANLLNDIQPSWATLPNIVLAKILKFVKLYSWIDLENASLTCKHWYSAVNDPEVWRTVTLNFDSSTTLDPQLKIIKRFGSYVESLTVNVDQFHPDNRQRSVALLSYLSKIEDRRLQRISIQFTGENPLFYGGQEFVEALHVVFGPPMTKAKKSFSHVDLHKVPVKYIDEIFYSLAANHCDTLTYLDLQNKQLICQITSTCIENLVENCRILTDLRISHWSMSNLVLQRLSDPNRARLSHLSLVCRRQEKYAGVDLSDDAWTSLKNANPGVKVTLKFDYTCTVNKMVAIMKPSVPVYYLFLECYCTPLDIFNAGDFYRETLTKLVVQAKTNPDLNSVLIDVAHMCPNLKYLHVLCVVELTTIQKLYEIRPQIAQMARIGKCTLKCTLEPHPWVSVDVLDEIPLHD